ncbi:MAG: hypothetical protein QM770_03735 [Tepidisphaeraceae bacterium]
MQSQFDWPVRPPAPLRSASPFAHDVARRFDLEIGDIQAAATQSIDSTHAIDAILPAPGQVTLLTGASGSGKSTLLRATTAHAMRTGVRALDLQTLKLSTNRCQRVVDSIDAPTLDERLRCLSRVGLAEAWTWLRRPSELSEGQAWRLRLALAIHRASARQSSASHAGKGPSVANDRTSTPSTLLVCDEFAALLDRVTAIVVARALRHAVDASDGQLRVIVVTSHDDLTAALQPDVSVRCDFGSIRVTRRSEVQP